MKFKGTWVLFLVVLLLGAYAYFGEYKQEIDEQKKKEEESSLVTSKVDQISSIGLVTLKEKISLVRSAEGWKIEEPVKDWAESEVVDSFLSGLIEEKYLEVAKEGDGINWADYGLDKPEGKLTLKTQAGQETLIEISGKKNFEGNSLLRLNNQNKVLIANSTWSSRAAKSAFEFRQKNLLRSKAAAIDTLKMKSPSGLVNLESKDGQWILTGNPKKTLDQNKVRALVTSLNETKALEILIDVKPSSSDLKKYSLDRPQIEIEANMKGQIWKAQIVQDKTKMIYAVTTEPPMLMKLDAGAYDKFQRVSSFQLRDRSTPFQIAKGDFKSLEFLNSLKKVKYEFDGVSWKVEPGSGEGSIPGNQIQDLVEKIKKIQVESFLDLAAGSKPEKFKPESSLIFKDGAGTELFRLDWMSAKKIKIDGIEKDLHLAKSNLSEEYFTMSESAVGGLKIEPPAPPNQPAPAAQPASPAAKTPPPLNESKR